MPGITEYLRRQINECEIEETNDIFYFFNFPHDKTSQFFTQKIRNLLCEFSLATAESLFSYIFSSNHAVNTYKGSSLENAPTELGHKYLSTTGNSYIIPEKRGFNLLEEKANLELRNSGVKN